MYAAAGVCEKFGQGTLRMQISDLVDGITSTVDARQSFRAKLGFPVNFEIRPSVFFQYDMETGGTQTTSYGEVDLEASPQNTMIEYPNLTYNWSVSGPIDTPRGMTVTVNSGTDNQRRYSELTFDIQPDGSGEEFGFANYFIECTITTTANGRSESVAFGRFRTSLEVEFV